MKEEPIYKAHLTDRDAAYIAKLEASRTETSREIRRVKQAAMDRAWRAKKAIAKIEKGA